MQKLHDQALSTSGADNAAIFENYRQLLAAPEFTNQTTGIIRSQKVNFEYAVKQVEENYRQILASDNAAYASSSMADFSVVVNAVIEALQSGVQRPLPGHAFWHPTTLHRNRPSVLIRANCLVL